MNLVLFPPPDRPRLSYRSKKRQSPFRHPLLPPDHQKPSVPQCSGKDGDGGIKAPAAVVRERQVPAEKEVDPRRRGVEHEVVLAGADQAAGVGQRTGETIIPLEPPGMERPPRLAQGLNRIAGGSPPGKALVVDVGGED